MNTFLTRTVFLYLIAMSLLCGVELKDNKSKPSELEKKVTTEIEKMRASKKPSVSKGELDEGTLEHAAELPSPEGPGYYLGHPDRKTNFGNDRLIFGLMALGVYMMETLGDTQNNRLRIHDISAINGGHLSPHLNHQMGLDADIGYYACDLAGNATATVWRTYDKDGKSEKADRIFDVARNWELFEGILKNKYFRKIRAILIANHLKKLLLDHANEKLKKLTLENKVTQKEQLTLFIKEAEKLFREPKYYPHDNHFHLSLSAE